MKSCVVLIGLLLGVFFVSSPIWAESRIVLDTGKSCQCISSEILQSDNHCYRARMRINSLHDETIEISGMEFHKLRFDNDASLDNVGEPSLPTIIQHIAIPNGSVAKFSLVEHQWEDVNIGKIYPSQDCHLTNNQDTSFYFSSEMYSREEYFPKTINVSEKFVWKGVENVYVTICPFKYYPSSNRLSILKDYVLKVEFIPDVESRRKTIQYREEDFPVFDNRNFMAPDSKNKRSLPNIVSPNYLIIVGDIPGVLNSQELSELCRWKAYKGYRTQVVSTQAIGADSASIKNFIEQQFQNGIEQVLFVGDEKTIPVVSLKPKLKDNRYPVLYSDYWYGCLDGENDIQAEIPIGRFIVETLSEFRNMVNKTIMYESSFNPYSNKVLFFANAQHDSRANYLKALDTILNADHVEAMSYTADYAAPANYGGNNATTIEVFNHINEGQNLLTYNGHSVAHEIWLNDNTMKNVDHFSYSIFYYDTIRVNSDKNFVFISTGCLNGDFTASSSMIRSFTRASNCAIAYLGDTYPMWTKGANRYLVRFYERLLNESNYHLGYLNLMTHLDNFGYGSEDITNAFGYICAGDPTLELWTGLQNTFQNVRLSLNQDSLIVSINNNSDYKVNVVGSDGALMGTYISTNGKCKIPIETNIFDIALDKHNYIPSIIHVDTSSHFIQNTTLLGNAYFLGSPISIGYNVTTNQPFGNVIIEPGSKVIIEKGEGINIKNGFECKGGSEFVIE